jgi:hypothetical protein
MTRDMSLREQERRQWQRTLQRLSDDDEVLTFRQWCRINALSERAGRRIIGAPGGPVVTQLSERRIGITRGNNRAWQKSRERV